MEISPDSSHMIHSLGKVMKNGGVGLVVDYGGDRSFSSSFRVSVSLKCYDELANMGSGFPKALYRGRV